MEYILKIILFSQVLIVIGVAGLMIEQVLTSDDWAFSLNRKKKKRNHE